MNSIVSAAAVATATAIPTETSPAATITDTVGRTFDCSPAATLQRAEQIVDLLRTRYIREGWKIDEEGAERALAYCRKYAANGPAQDDDYQDAIDFGEAIDFFHNHGVSIDWVFGGDIAGLICGAAKYSPRAGDVTDSNLLALAEQYILAERAYGDIASKVDEIEFDFKNQNERPLPEALLLQSTDGELGLPCPTNLYLRARLGTSQESPPAFDLLDDITRLRAKKWGSSGTYTEPTPAARTRADEIIAAYEEWQTTAKKPPRGYRKLVRERDKAARAYQNIEKQIANTPARTARGMFAKVRCAQHWTHGSVDKIDSGTSEETMAISIFDDVKRMSGDRLAAAEASWLPSFSSRHGEATDSRRTKGKVKSQYQLYPMPFFNAERRCTWNVEPTGDYGVDCETGRKYAVEFLESCDGTIGWGTILGQISRDMIRAGAAETPVSGKVGGDGIVIGFMGTIGKVLAAFMPVILSQRQA